MANSWLRGLVQRPPDGIPDHAQQNHGHAHPVAPIWDSHALLNPRAGMPKPSVTQPPLSTIQRPDRSSSSTPSSAPVAFEFVNATYDFQPSPASTPQPNGAYNAERAGGAGSILERGFRLEDRTTVPQPKRRKTEEGSAAIPKKKISGGSGGVIGTPLRDMANTTVPQMKQSETVDLTAGKSCC